MKKLVFCSIAAMLFMGAPFNVNAQTAPEPVAKVELKNENTEVKMLCDRLEVIRKMDKSKLSRPERKNLRNEVKAIKEKLETNASGIYISVGAAILIAIILLILL